MNVNQYLNIDRYSGTIDDGDSDSESIQNKDQVLKGGSKDRNTCAADYCDSDIDASTVSYQYEQDPALGRCIESGQWL